MSTVFVHPPITFVLRDHLIAIDWFRDKMAQGPAKSSMKRLDLGSYWGGETTPVFNSLCSEYLERSRVKHAEEAENEPEASD